MINCELVSATYILNGIARATSIVVLIILHASSSSSACTFVLVSPVLVGSKTVFALSKASHSTAVGS